MLFSRLLLSVDLPEQATIKLGLKNVTNNITAKNMDYTNRDDIQHFPCPTAKFPDFLPTKSNP